jgi:hypothetical protein
MNGHRLTLFTPNLEGNDPRNAAYSSNLFFCNKFHTLMHDRNTLNSFLCRDLRTPLSQRRGGVSCNPLLSPFWTLPCFPTSFVFNNFQ